MRSNFLLILFLLFAANGFAQKKQEKEYRIQENQLPENVIVMLGEHLNGAKRLRYYREIDGENSSYEVKFKKDKLFYSVEFDESGTLEDVEFIIKENDIPQEPLQIIKKHLSNTYGKFRIKKIQQQYLNDGPEAKTVLRKAFQNLILPEINYEIIIAVKDKEGYSEYEVTYNANGEHLLTRKSIAPKYDHVLFQ
ncbi:MAG: hypothetical protein AAGH81_14775 [Bacteroidota bacterium]